MAAENLDLEIRAWLARYVRGEITLTEFKDWFVPNTWNVHESGNPLAPGLAYWVDARIDEYVGGVFGERRLKSLLDREVDTYRFVYGEALLSSRPTLSLGAPLVNQRQLVGAGI